MPLNQSAQNVSPGTSQPQAFSRGWNPWPASIIGFFCLAIVGLLGFAVFCSLHPSELVSADYYEQELEYQGQMERAERAREIGSQASIVYDAAGRVITLKLPQEHAVAHPSGRIVFYRASESALDRSVPLALDASGVQRLDAAALRPGLWKVKVTWKSGGREYYLDRAVRIES